MCLKPASDMAEAHAEGELRDQLADLEAQLQQIDEALEATDGADPELKTVHEHLLLRVAQGALRLVQTNHVCGAGARGSAGVRRGVPSRAAADSDLYISC